MDEERRRASVSRRRSSKKPFALLFFFLSFFLFGVPPTQLASVWQPYTSRADLCRNLKCRPVRKEESKMLKVVAGRMRDRYTTKRNKKTILPN